MAVSYLGVAARGGGLSGARPIGVLPSSTEGAYDTRAWLGRQRSHPNELRIRIQGLAMPGAITERNVTNY